MSQSTNIEWLRTEHESLKVDLLEDTLGAEPHIVEQFEDYFDGVEELIVSHESQAAEITRLKEQLARTERERDQAIEAGALVVAGGSIHTDSDDGYRGTVQHYPDLYAHLAGKVEGC